MAYEDDNFIDSTGLVWNYSFFTDEDVKSFRKGAMYYAYEKFGAHECQVLKTPGVYFAVWAPNATEVSVIGEFNGWKEGVHQLFVRLDKSGIWEGFIPRLPEGVLYKYHIVSPKGSFYKADPFGSFAEVVPGKASKLFSSCYQWKDEEWMNNRKHHNTLHQPWSVYEVHLMSWMRPDKNDPHQYNTYTFLADKLVSYVKGMQFTHVEFLPVMEYPYDGSWGYQTTGYFAPTSRLGTPDEFRLLIDTLHQNNIGVILDWVPSHFPGDAHGLHLFDGYHTYEYEDGRKGYHPDWQSYIFNYERPEVQSFLLSSAHYWLKEFHVDGLRVDAVNSILRLDYSRQPGEWVPNKFGGNENLEAAALLRKINKHLYTHFEGIQTIAEESGAWPAITHPISKKGYGFGMKWMMGWMHDVFRYFKRPFEERALHQNDLTFAMMYYYDERFMLPFSHDEVVHGKSPVIYKMHGNEQEKFAQLRLLYAFMFLHPGVKLLFMGNEFGQTSEWDYSKELDWELLQFDTHNLLQECVRDLNIMYKSLPALHQLQFNRKGFQWEQLEDEDPCLMAFRRKTNKREQDVLVIVNAGPRSYVQKEWHISGKNQWKEIFNTNDRKYCGTGGYMNDYIPMQSLDKKRRSYILKLNIPAFSVMVFY